MPRAPSLYSFGVISRPSTAVHTWSDTPLVLHDRTPAGAAHRQWPQATNQEAALIGPYNLSRDILGVGEVSDGGCSLRRHEGEAFVHGGFRDVGLEPDLVLAVDGGLQK